MPKRLVIIALVFCAVGAACIWALVARGPALAVGLGILALPLGVGLLLGRKGARSWASGVLLALCLLVLALGVVRALFTGVALLAPATVTLRLAGITLRGWPALPGVMVATALATLALYALRRQLDADVVRRYCGGH